MMHHTINRLKEIDKLTMIRNTGNPAALAARLGISERSLYDHIKLMRELGAPIAFSLYLNSYYYSRGGTFIIRFVDELRNNDVALSEQGSETSSATKRRVVQ